jgi:SAM-dependent methyltransferase
MDWDRFLPLARCPRCRAPIEVSFAGIACTEGHGVRTNPAGVPLFAPPRPPSPREGEERRRHVEAYAGLNAYGYLVIGTGHAEGLYRSVADILMRALPSEADLRILDVGCGVGRTAGDLAEYFTRAFVVGIDRDEFALDLAHACLTVDGPPIPLNLRRLGFGEAPLPRRVVPNLFLAQGVVEDLPLARPEEGGGFDAVLSVNLLDRVPEPEPALMAMASLVRPGGLLLLADPLDWWQSDGALWERYGRGLEGIVSLVTNQKFSIEFALDGLLYRELNDARGSCTDWPVAVVLARAPRG